MHDPSQLLCLTTDIVVAALATETFRTANVADLIRETHDALAATAQPAVAEPVKPTPAVPARGSVKADHILSLIDGKPYKMLRRHIGLHGYTPETYRAAFGLPGDYPMVAPSYSAERAQLAKRIGLGTKANRGISQVAA